jgi:hypothetical protein
MSNYITSGSLTAYQPVANMAAYITSGSLVQYQSKFWVAFEYLNTGPAVNSFGQVNITTGSISSSQAGNYLITMPAHPSGANYGIMVVSRAAGIAYANYSGSKSSTQFRVYTYNSSGALANS